MIIVTGAAGFIGSNLIKKLNSEGIDEIMAVDDFSDESKNRNLSDKKYSDRLHRDLFFKWMNENHRHVKCVFHMGARTDTAEFDRSVFERLNLGYSRKVWQLCSAFQIPLIYASSAATYGLGELGYIDSHEIVEKLQPLNPYGESKNDFDKWVLRQNNTPPQWQGFKFFNVYGPNEYHKGRMASVVFHACHQIMSTGKMKLFKSHRPDFKDGEQKRDFIYVKDVTGVLFYFMRNRKPSGIYNLGTGRARTFTDLVNGVFGSMNKPVDIEFIDTPADIRDRYQYFTEAKMDKLRNAGYTAEFTDLETGVDEYVTKYLIPGRYH
ncbi:MAG: ADP-glyceromanno-heptose 6-epimerase [Bacteroidales bacterium]|nr:ADP-glyceromanno-heptose 6-epimerase [Bacteroidales bacterium]